MSKNKYKNGVVKTFIVLSVIFLSVLICFVWINQDNYKKVVWDTLNDEDISSIRKYYDEEVDYRIGSVKPTIRWMIGTYRIENGNLDTRGLLPVIEVEFKTHLDPLLGPIVSHIDPFTCKIVGYNLRF